MSDHLLVEGVQGPDCGEIVRGLTEVTLSVVHHAENDLVKRGICFTFYGGI